MQYKIQYNTLKYNMITKGIPHKFLNINVEPCKDNIILSS